MVEYNCGVRIGGLAGFFPQHPTTRITKKCTRVADQAFPEIEAQIGDIGLGPVPQVSTRWSRLDARTRLLGVARRPRRKPAEIALALMNTTAFQMRQKANCQSP